MFKVNNKTTERRQWTGFTHCWGISITDFEQIQAGKILSKHLFMVEIVWIDFTFSVNFTQYHIAEFFPQDPNKKRLPEPRKRLPGPPINNMFLKLLVTVVHKTWDLISCSTILGSFIVTFVKKNAWKEASNSFKVSRWWKF